MEATGQLVYPEIMGGAPIPRGPDIYEWTRTCIAPERRDAAGGMDRAARLVFCGVAEACVMLGIRGLTVETDPLWITRFLELGWRAKPLALPVEYEGESLVPIYVDVDETTLERCRDLLGVAGPVLTVDDNFEPSRIAVRAPAEVVASN